MVFIKNVSYEMKGNLRRLVKDHVSAPRWTDEAEVVVVAPVAPRRASLLPSRSPSCRNSALPRRLRTYAVEEFGEPDLQQPRHFDTACRAQACQRGWLSASRHAPARRKCAKLGCCARAMQPAACRAEARNSALVSAAAGSNSACRCAVIRRLVRGIALVPAGPNTRCDAKAFVHHGTSSRASHRHRERPVFSRPETRRDYGLHYPERLPVALEDDSTSCRPRC